VITLRVDSRAHLAPVSKIPGFLLDQIKRRLTFPNPDYLENERRGFSNWDTPQEVRGYRVEGDDMVIPRGFSRQLVGILKNAGAHYQLDDRRRVLPEVDFTFRGELRDFEEAAVEAIISRDFGTLAAPTGSGKTVMALAMIAWRRQPALVLVHTR
jgi:hypothetical protein